MGKKGGVRGQEWFFWAEVGVKWQMAAAGNSFALKESKVSAVELVWLQTARGTWWPGF